MNDLGIVHDTTELRKLIAENPDLPIVVLADEEANSGDGGYEYCQKVYCSLGEILDCEIPFGGGVVPTDKEDFEDELSDYLWDLLDGETLTEGEFDKRLKEEMAKYEPYWKKVIEILATN